MALQPLRYLCVLCVSAVSLICESHSTANRYKEPVFRVTSCDFVDRH
jgi:hypothetical protein